MHSLRISSDVRPRLRSVFSCIFGDDELLVQRAAVDADAHRLVVVDGDLADRGELLVAPAAGADVARIDAVLVERRGAVREARQQQMAVVVEVADERRRAAGVEHALLDFRDRGRRLGQVDGDPHHLRAGFRQLDALLRRRLRHPPYRSSSSTGRRPARRRRPGRCPTRTPTVLWRRATRGTLD